MPVDPTVVQAYKRCYTPAELKFALKQALDDYANGVKVTQVNFQEGGGSGVISGDPQVIIATLEICLQEIEGGRDAGPAPLAAGINFSTRRCET